MTKRLWPSKAEFEIRCHVHGFKCEMAFEDERAQVLVRFSSTLLPYWNHIRTWVAGNLEDARWRAKTFGRPVTIRIDQSGDGQ